VHRLFERNALKTSNAPVIDLYIDVNIFIYIDFLCCAGDRVAASNIITLHPAASDQIVC
jgi:hypothetical protein